MLRNNNDDRERERGGEAPMEIDSPPPLWLKSPTSKIILHKHLLIKSILLPILIHF